MRIDMYVIRQGHSTNRCFLESQVGLVGLLSSCCCCVGEWRAVEKCILCDIFSLPRQLRSLKRISAPCFSLAHNLFCMDFIQIVVNKNLLQFFFKDNN